jgi:hypothetical protein
VSRPPTEKFSGIDPIDRAVRQLVVHQPSLCRIVIFFLPIELNQTPPSPPAGTVLGMSEHDETVTADFGPEDYERLAHAARAAGKPLKEYLRDSANAAAQAAEAAFREALQQTERTAELLAPFFSDPEDRQRPQAASQDTPMGTRQLRALQHGHAA